LCSVKIKFGIRDATVRYCLERDGCEVDTDDLMGMADFGETLMILLPGEIWTKVCMIL
jgi:hypothetical protein